MSDNPLALRATRGRQISVFLDDKPGTLGHVTRLLGERNVNLHALSLAEGIDHGYLRMVVDREDEACAALKEDGYLFFEKEVLLLEISNTPGSLGRVAEAFGERGINIEYAYCAGGPGVDRGLIVIRVDQLESALEQLT